MPPPFNVIPTPKMMWYIILWFKDKLCRCNKKHQRNKWQSIRVRDRAGRGAPCPPSSYLHLSLIPWQNAFLCLFPPYFSSSLPFIPPLNPPPIHPSLTPLVHSFTLPSPCSFFQPFLPLFTPSHPPDSFPHSLLPAPSLFLFHSFPFPQSFPSSTHTSSLMLCCQPAFLVQCTEQKVSFLILRCFFYL